MNTVASGQRRVMVWASPPIRSLQGPGAPEIRMARAQSESNDVSKRPNAATEGGDVGKS